MFEWAVSDGELRVVDPGRRRVAEATDWVRDDGDGSSPDAGVSLSGTATGLWLRVRTAVVTSADAGASRETDGGGSAVSRAVGAERRLGARRHHLRAAGDARVSVAFDGPATVRRDADGVAVSFPDRTAVTLALDAVPECPADSVTVPPTPRGVAAALTRAAETPLTTGPMRSHPAQRPHPPKFEFDARADPPAVDGATDVELLAPDDWGTVYALAPLTYYLGARVSVDPDCRTPRLRTETLDRPLDPVDEAAPALLQRAFWLDCLVRDHADATPAEVDLLSTLDLEAADCRGPPASRLERHLAVDFDRIADALPTWHLAAYVAPTPENAAALPFLLDRLALVYPPETDPLSGKELMERSLDEFYRGHIPSVDVVKPRLREAGLHGWLAPETPIDVFTCPPEAYENRVHYRGRAAPMRVVVVLNDAAMAGEHDDVAATYRARNETVPVDVSVRYALTCAELAEVFVEGADLVHYIGHCETDGLRCSDGHLSVADLPESNAQTFFLNACGSYHEGMELVRKGSAVGGVTYREVLDEQAATVGATFARLLTRGFSFERAVQLSRRRVMMGKDYAVVGDGTHAVTQFETDVPVFARVTTRNDGRYRLAYRAATDRTAGDTFRPEVAGATRAHFCGAEPTFTVDRDDLVAFLSRETVPVVFDGSFYWSTELVSRLSR